MNKQEGVTAKDVERQVKLFNEHIGRRLEQQDQNLRHLNEQMEDLRNEMRIRLDAIERILLQIAKND